MRIKPFLIAGLFILQQYIVHAQPTNKTEVLTNKNIIDLHKAGIDDDLIVAKIQSAECKFDLSTNGMIELKNKGVPSALIKVMMNKADGKPLTFSSPATSSGLPNSNTSVTGKNKNIPGKADSPSLELMNYVYCLIGSGQSAKPLEKSIVGVRNRPGMFHAESRWHLDGAKSAARISIADATAFVISTGSAELPNLVLYTCHPDKDGRKAVYVKGTMTGLKESPDLIPVNITKLAEGTYRLIPGKPLTKGEYFFTTKPAGTEALSVDAYAFGVE